MAGSSVVVAVVAVVAIIGIGLLVLPSPSNSPQNAAGSASKVTATVVATDAQDLAGVQFDISYDASVVRYVGATEGNFLDGGDNEAAMLLAASESSGGVVEDLILLRVRLPGVDGSGNLAQVHFERVGAGDPRIGIQNVLVSDSAGAALASDLIQVIV